MNNSIYDLLIHIFFNSFYKIQKSLFQNSIKKFHYIEKYTHNIIAFSCLANQLENPNYNELNLFTMEGIYRCWAIYIYIYIYIYRNIKTSINALE
jgi:hypothetical protein